MLLAVLGAAFLFNVGEGCMLVAVAVVARWASFSADRTAPDGHATGTS